MSEPRPKYATYKHAGIFSSGVYNVGGVGHKNVLFDVIVPHQVYLATLDVGYLLKARRGVFSVRVLFLSDMMRSDVRRGCDHFIVTFGHSWDLQQR